MSQKCLSNVNKLLPFNFLHLKEITDCLPSLPQSLVVRSHLRGDIHNIPFMKITTKIRYYIKRNRLNLQSLKDSITQSLGARASLHGTH